MEEDTFNELLESVKEGDKILKGEIKPSRYFKIEPLEIKKIRSATGKTQKSFAEMIGVNINTLRNWEQGRRQPEGPARTLLKIVSKYPDIVQKALSE